MNEHALAVCGLHAGYGSFRALFDINFTLEEGETLALVGANGAGKSTLLKSIVGLMPTAPEMIRHHGVAIGGFSTDRIVARGITLVPEGRRLFADLSVEENLIIGGQLNRSGGWTLAAVYDLFPGLKTRRRLSATALSGGQQQMVAIARALMANPEIVLFDEMSLGLSPIAVEEIYGALPRITGGKITSILVEQDIGRALRVSTRFICMREGRIVLEGLSQNADRDMIVAAYFGANK